jgi:hypothetical protein
MTDVLYLVTVLVAFAALVGLVRLCDRLVGPDEFTPMTESSAAVDPANPVRANPEGADQLEGGTHER